MVLQALRAAPEDFRTLADIHADAFKDNPLNLLMYPNKVTPASLEASFQRMKLHHKDPSTHFVKAVDTETGEITGVARWNVYLSGRPQEELDAPTVQIPKSPDANAELIGEVIDVLEKTRKETMGRRPHCSLNLLAVSPKHQRRGAGAVLVKYGTDIADKENIEAYLESTQDGYSLYKRTGFQDRGFVELDVSKWSGVASDIRRFPQMIRPAQGESQSN
ncbi:hypothetical protein FQN54_000591 [Arachnomyces sp. PD_36]|nr:hypothetical protein FQN54_000591 [Arachnomyces sp. PD_36]